MSLARIFVFIDAGYPRQGMEKKIAEEGFILEVSYGEKRGSLIHVVGYIFRKQRIVSN